MLIRRSGVKGKPLAEEKGIEVCSIALIARHKC
jgi:hypothetical protein